VLSVSSSSVGAAFSRFITEYALVTATTAASEKAKLPKKHFKPNFGIFQTLLNIRSIGAFGAQIA
jgi:hypothetical protein